MRDILGIGILGVVGYYLYQNYFKTSVTTINTDGTSTTQPMKVIDWNTVSLPNIVPGSTAANLMNQLLVDAATNQNTSMLTFDGWNYYYNKRSGGFLQAQNGLSTTTPISIVQFLSQMQSGAANYVAPNSAVRGIGELNAMYSGRNMMNVNGYERR